MCPVHPMDRIYTWSWLTWLVQCIRRFALVAAITGTQLGNPVEGGDWLEDTCGFGAEIYSFCLFKIMCFAFNRLSVLCKPNAHCLRLLKLRTSGMRSKTAIVETWNSIWFVDGCVIEAVSGHANLVIFGDWLIDFDWLLNDVNAIPSGKYGMPLDIDATNMFLPSSTLLFVHGPGYAIHGQPPFFDGKTHGIRLMLKTNWLK